MRIEGASFSVLGMGKSGVAAANLLARLGGDVLLSDGKDTDELRRRAEDLVDFRVHTVFGRETVRPGDVAVVSPGIAPAAPAFRNAYRLASEVIGEVELFCRLFPGRILAVTGTDGKSTTTTLAAHLLNAAGIPAHAAGNLGNPLCDLIGVIDDNDVVVAEVSCFQLLTTVRFRPQVALVTNLAEDHLEHHGSWSAYVAAKARVIERQAHGDVFIRNLDDGFLANWLRPGDSWTRDNGQHVRDVSRSSPVADGAFLLDGGLHLARDGRETRVAERSEFPLPGAHNTENLLMALAATSALGAEPDGLVRGLTTYQGLPHRIERVRVLDGVTFFNDSKATNPHAAITALRAFDRRVVLIAGGFEKGLPLSDLALEIERRCSAVVLTGDCADRMKREFPRSVPSEIVDDLESAVIRAYELARPDGIVLFSPAASSFDHYTSFEHRGDRFREIVQAL
jgi:UDP-N-acetylmuramoylalanine--D-glutamate ligase